MVLTVKEIITILKNATFTGQMEDMQIREGDRAFHLYPSIEVSIPQPLSPRTDQQVATNEERFNVTVLVRFTRELGVEYEDLNSAERVVLSTLDAQPLQDGEFFFENRNWDRVQTKDVHGVESTLTVLFRQITPAVPGGIVGAGATLNLDAGGVVLELIDQTTLEDGRNFSNTWQDDAKRFPIPDGSLGVRFFEYAWTETDFNLVQAFIDAGAYIVAIYSQGVFSRALTVLPIMQRTQTSYSGLRTSTLQVEIQGT